MTNEELIALSKRVAEKLGIEPFVHKRGTRFVADEKTWLHEDSERCFDLMCEHNLSLSFGYYTVEVSVAWATVGYAYELFDHDRKFATRVAILKALDAQ